MAKKKMTLEEKLNETIVTDVPYEVPGNWMWIEIGSVVEVVNGGTPKSNVSEYYENGDVAWITPADLSGYNATYISRGRRNITKLGLEKSSAKLMPKDSVLMSSRAPIGYVVIAENSISTNQGFKCFLPSPIYLPKYLYFYLKYSKDLIETFASGTTFLELSGAKAKMIPFPIPPLKEQQRIVDRIESLFEKLDKAKKLIEEAREGFEKRKSAVLEKAFRGKLTSGWRKINNNLPTGEELFESIKEKRFSIVSSNKEKKDIELLFEKYNFINDNLPHGWIKLKSAMICELITCGKTPTGNIVSCGDVPYLKVYNIVNNKINFEYRPQFIDYETHSKKLKSSMLKSNDVIMNIVGPPLKKIAIIPNTYNDWNMNQAIVRFRTIENIDYKFFYYCLVYDETLREVINETRGVVGQANISVSQSRNLNIIVPSLEEQKEIVRILDKLFEKESKVEELTQLEEQIELIKKSILAKAFRGELGTNCEEDESVLELLKEILRKE